MRVTLPRGPGCEAREFAEGLTLGTEAETAGAEFTDGELFWIVKHGIRMTGMPRLWQNAQRRRCLEDCRCRKTSSGLVVRSKSGTFR